MQRCKKWMKFLKKYFDNKPLNNVRILNLTIRYVDKDINAFIKYAKQDVYAFVFYYRISKDFGDIELQNIHMDLSDEAIRLNGTFYLPYRHHYNKYQLLTAYPEIKKFIILKKKYDSLNIFCNLWYDFVLDILKK